MLMPAHTVDSSNTNFRNKNTLCDGSPPVTGRFPYTGPVMAGDLCYLLLDKKAVKQTAELSTIKNTKTPLCCHINEPCKYVIFN